MSSTLERLAHPLEPEASGILSRRRWLFRIVFGLVCLLLALTVLDGLDVLEVVGPDEETSVVSGGGYVLEVEHPSVSRPALASVFRITVRHDGGFDEPLQVGITRRYLEAWDVNGILPAPSSETAVGDWILWEFDPPPGEELTITYEARFEPGLQVPGEGAVAVFEDDVPVVDIEFTTRMMP